MEVDNIVVLCPKCKSFNVKIHIVKVDVTMQPPRTEYEYCCEDCGHWFYDPEDGGKGVL